MGYIGGPIYQSGRETRSRFYASRGQGLNNDYKQEKTNERRSR